MRLTTSPAVVLSLFFVSSNVLAQGTKKSKTSDNPTTAAAPPPSTAAPPTKPTTAAPAPPTTTAAPAPPSSTAQPPPVPSSSSPSAPSSTASVPSLPPVTSSTSTSSSTQSVANLPPATTPSNTGTYDGIANAPTLVGAYSYPAPTVPSLSMAPFMRSSNLPNGTVFIAVGAILGFFFAIIVIWRALVAFSLRRSIRRANEPIPTRKYREGDERKSMLRNPAPFYANRPGSNMSLDHLAGAGKGGLQSGPRSSLFYSPTAGASMQSPANRGSSSYLPAGFYAAGNAAPGGNFGRPASQVDFPADRSQNQSNPRLRPTPPPRAPSGQTPPITPELAPSGAGELYVRGHQAGMSNVSLLSNGRAPSAYLEDLFDYPPVPDLPPGSRSGSRSGEKKH